MEICLGLHTSRGGVAFCSGTRFFIASSFFIQENANTFQLLGLPHVSAFYIDLASLFLTTLSLPGSPPSECVSLEDALSIW